VTEYTKTMHSRKMQTRSRQILSPGDLLAYVNCTS